MQADVDRIERELSSGVDKAGHYLAELARELAMRAERATASDQRDSAVFSSSRPKSTPGAGDGTADLPVAVQPDRLRQILDESREPLSDLRILVRRTADRRVTDPNSLHRSHRRGHGHLRCPRSTHVDAPDSGGDWFPEDRPPGHQSAVQGRRNTVESSRSVLSCL